MDLYRIIDTLHQEKKRLDDIIASLERMQGPGAPRAGRKRGRPPMDSSARQAVSERMRQYWEERRGKSKGGGAAG